MPDVIVPVAASLVGAKSLQKVVLRKLPDLSASGKGALEFHFQVSRPGRI